MLGVILSFALFFGYIKLRDNIRLKTKTEELKALSRKLEQAKNIAEEASRTKSQFLAIISHELRTPLQGIIGYTDLMLERANLNGDIEYEDDLNYVFKNGKTLTKIINDILSYTEFESGEKELNIIEVDVNTLVKDAIDNVKQERKNNNQLHIDIPANQRFVNADYHMLLHVLVNLLSNAEKFTEKGEIWISSGHKGNRYEIKVKDSGIGISPVEQGNIFEPFEQVDGSATRKYGGTGIGLTISKKFMELMGGVIRVDSEPGQGSEFVISLPVPPLSSM